MTTRNPRKYQSHIRTQQAESTRQKILAAAMALFKSGGYDQTAIEAIAQKAGVSTPTIYAVFGSKKAILKQLVESAMFGQPYQEAVDRVFFSTDPMDRLRSMSGVARSVHDAKNAVLELFRGAGVVSPEIATLQKENESRRYESQKPVIDFLFQKRVIRRGISRKKARDIAWCLTGSEIYRMLVLEKGWTSNDYQRWLGDALVRSLMAEG